MTQLHVCQYSINVLDAESIQQSLWRLSFLVVGLLGYYTMLRFVTMISLNEDT